jgi:hypothetical protein
MAGSESHLMDRQTIAYVVDRAATWRRNRYRDDDRYQHYTEGALLEQVCGQVGALFNLGDGWWLVGKVMDVIAGFELEVLVNPGERKIQLREIAPPPEKAPPTPMLPAKPKRRFSRVSEWKREYEQWREWQE